MPKKKPRKGGLEAYIRQVEQNNPNSSVLSSYARFQDAMDKLEARNIADLNNLRAQNQGRKGLAQSQYNPLGRGVLTPSQLGSLLGSSRPPQKSNMEPAFDEGDEVSVPGYGQVFKVVSWRSMRSSGREVFEYELRDEEGNRQYQREADIKPFTGMEPTKTIIDFESVIISDDKRSQILEAIEQINQHDLIFKQWGFDTKIEKGRGVSMLFHGPPGTGKTLMGQAIAQKLGKILKVISTADIESSSPGESERNIRKHFKEAKKGNTILLFDECDSLIYSRSSVGPILSAQVNELLSQIERFNGITIFTTNRLGTLDEAVNRRLALKLEFPMPDQGQRAEIWKRMIPEQAPLHKDVDFDRLAIVEIAGGHIKNAVLRAARIAANVQKPDNKKKLEMNHFVRAVTQEAESVVDFQDAQDEHQGNVGEVVGVEAGSGRRVVRKRDMKKVRGNGKS